MTRILIVEDEESLSEPLAYLLGKEGFDPEVVADGQASLEELGQRADPPMTKDAVAGRIRRLLAMADKRAEELGIPGTDHGVDEDHLPSSPDAGR